MVSMLPFPHTIPCYHFHATVHTLSTPCYHLNDTIPMLSAQAIVPTLLSLQHYSIWKHKKCKNWVLKVFLPKRDHHKNNSAIAGAIKQNMWKIHFFWERTIIKIMSFQNSCYSYLHAIIIMLPFTHYLSHSTIQMLLFACYHSHATDPNHASTPMLLSPSPSPCFCSNAAILMLQSQCYCPHATIPTLLSLGCHRYATIPLLPSPF